MPTRLFEFTLWLTPESREFLDWANAIYESGGDDSSPGEHCGAPYVSFHREAETLDDAVRSAYDNVQAAGCQVVRCEIDREGLLRLTA